MDFLQILLLLISHGANCNITQHPIWGDDGSRVHAIAAAALNNHPKCVELLIPHVNKETLKETEVSIKICFLKVNLLQQLKEQYKLFPW